jgi:hypothetical protein
MPKKQRGIGGSHGYKLKPIKLPKGGIGGAKRRKLGRGYKTPKIHLPKIRLNY